MIRVTITGADDAVDPKDLVALSRDFPDVEWGILLSDSRKGTPRYPSSEWADQVGMLSLRKGMRISGHVCGAWARALCAGDATRLPVPPMRVQINGYEHSAFPGVRKVAEAAVTAGHEVELILQCRTEADLQATCFEAEKLPNASVLFDPSGGRGLQPFSWPRAPVGARVGYAGGITPQNVEEVIGDIAAAHSFMLGDFWLDMESGVRDADDRFNIWRAREVLERVAKVNSRLASAEVRHA